MDPYAGTDEAATAVVGEERSGGEQTNGEEETGRGATVESKVACYSRIELRFQSLPLHARSVRRLEVTLLESLAVYNRIPIWSS